MSSIGAIIVAFILIIIGVLQHLKTVEKKELKEKELLEETSLVDCPDCKVVDYEDCKKCNGFGRLQKNVGDDTLSTCSSFFIRGYKEAKSLNVDDVPYFLKYRAEEGKRGWLEGNKKKITKII